MDGMVLPDLTKPLTKKIKEGKIMMEKLYMPFMDLYFDTEGTVTNTVTLVGNKLVDKLLKMIEVMQGLYKETEEKNETERKKEDPQEEKKRSWIMERWQKIIKLGFFQKTLGFLKGLASVSFITELLTFLILLRLGIFQRFLPLIVSVMGSALESLIEEIPNIIKFIWEMLSEKLPEALKSVFNTALETLGLENEGFFILADALAEGLPILLAIVLAFSKLAPIISGIGGLISGVGSVLAFIGLAIIKLLALVGIVVTLPAWVVGAIAVAVVALGALIWTFREQIGDFFAGLWEGIKEVFFSVMGSIGDFFAGLWEGIKEVFFGLWEGIKEVFFSAIGSIGDFFAGLWEGITEVFFSVIGSIGDFFAGLWEGIKEVFFSVIGSIGEYISEAWHSIIVKPIQRVFGALRRRADPVFKKMQPIIDAVSSIFGSIGSGVTKMIDGIKSALDSMLSWFSNVADFGMYDWMTMDKDKKAKFTEKQAELREDPLVQFAEKKITEEQAAQRLGMKDGQLSPGQMAEVEKMRSLQTGKFANTEIATIIASEMAGVIKDINSDHRKQSGIIGTLTFVKNNSSTKGSQ